MNPVEKVKSFSLKDEPLLLTEKTIDPEVQEYKNKLASYGIKNKTVKKIEDSFKKEAETKKEIAKQSATNELIRAFAPFKLIEYKTLDEVCKEHGLVIASLAHYDKAIPDENVLELDNFMEALSQMREDITSNIYVRKNTYFTFSASRDCNVHLLNKKYPELSATSDRMFKIAAPKKHFNIPKGHIKIGNEYSRADYKKPGFKYTPEFNLPSFEIDPIIFMPISFGSKLFCVIVTAWDKVADDSRILSKL